MSVSMAGAEVWGITSGSPPRPCTALLSLQWAVQAEQWWEGKCSTAEHSAPLAPSEKQGDTSC